jgi:hypothetical protein
METFSIVLAIALLISGPLFFGVSVFLVVLYFRQRQRARMLEQALAKSTTRFEAQVKVLEQNALQALRDEWLRGIGKGQYNNEIEVEIKFIYPLLQFLGYGRDDFQIRVPVSVQVGRQRNKGEADWVIWHRDSKNQRRAVAVIEAKRDDQPLDISTQEQARSYAFALNAPMYVLTNGRRVRVFRRGVQNDTCIVDCEACDLMGTWNVVEGALGAKSWLKRPLKEKVTS